ncbi:GGDEF domain-containing protein [Vibrio sp. SCSIO 43137]|uniref:GGDEF domain-containing protein n=1 Tax=Vibrio sp. SCSIO 43137 TaxID=3021011 RepID=UPI002307E5E8|nr:sensor domain-containing diguanylate cyclase [Vibrio sp. SCSIO 43137]WCE31396.1 diguanylate cyclase [Vibrio sp. SCSIO 43137]
MQLKLATESGKFGQWQWHVKKNRFHGDFVTHQIIGAEPGASDSFRSVWKSTVHPNDITRVETELNLALSDDKAFDSEFRIIQPGNKIITVRCRAVRLNNSSLDELILSGVIWDISEQKRLKKENQKLATQDLLTNAKNRKGFMPLAEAEFEKAKRYHTSFAILRFRIKDFQSLNENFGHSMGELALTSFANTCISELRGSDLLCRFDADDFVALLHDNHLNNARLVADRLQTAIEQLEITSCGISFEFSINIGLAEFQPSDDSLEDTLQRAQLSLENRKPKPSSA